MNAPESTHPAVLPRRERLAILGALLGIAALCWAYLALLAEEMGAMGPVAMASGAMPSRAWSGAEFALMFAMWWVMMIGMMLPSAAPMILMFGRINQGKRARGTPYVPTLVFVGGYLVAWGGYSLAATFAQWGLERFALLTPMMETSDPLLGGGLFVLAGLYQLTPLKTACLRHCRSPLGFIVGGWRDGVWGAVAMGLAHGTYCLGCCAALMVLLFVGGVMNLLWVAAIAVFVLVEKALPLGLWSARVGGVLMIGFGAWLMLAG